MKVSTKKTKLMKISKSPGEEFMIMWGGKKLSVEQISLRVSHV